MKQRLGANPWTEAEVKQLTAQDCRRLIAVMAAGSTGYHLMVIRWCSQRIKELG